MRTRRFVLTAFTWSLFTLTVASCINLAAPPAPPATSGVQPTLASESISTTVRTIPAGFVEYVVLDEGFALALPDSWNVIELDERRFQTNMDQLEASDPPRAEFERSEGSYYIDFSVAFYGYLPHNDEYEALDADIRINRSDLAPRMNLKALTKDYIRRIESSGYITLPVEARSLRTVGGLELSEVSCSVVYPESRLDYKYYLFVRGRELLEMMIRVVQGADTENYPPSEEIARSFRWLDASDRVRPAADGAIILSNGLITETLASGSIRYDSTRDGFSITLPANWTEIPLRNGETIAAALSQFTTSVDELGWPETSPSYLDFEMLAARGKTRVLWADSDRKGSDDLVTLRVSAYPEEAGKTLDMVAEEALRSIAEDSENATLITSERFETTAGAEGMEIRHSKKRMGKGEENLTITSYYYISDTAAYVLALQVLESEAGKYIPVAREIAASFVVTQEAGVLESTP